MNHPTLTVADLIATLDTAYPPHLAEEWDTVGLICGDPAAEVRRVAVALDCTQAVVDAALAAEADFLLVHHPLLLRGVSTVGAHTPKGALIHRLIRSGCALFAAHTNADSARPGVNDKLAQILDITPGAPLAPKPDSGLDLWVIKVPQTHTAAVKDSVFAAGAGEIGEYSHCAFTSSGVGQFTPQAAAQPFLGTAGEATEVTEDKLEFVAPPALRSRVEQALRAAHPYEEPAFDLLHSTVPTVASEQALGLGRIGELATPMRFADFVAHVAARLPQTQWGVRGAGDPERMIRTVAVASGSGDSFLEAARRAGVDAFVTSDLRHHPVDEFLRTEGPAVVDTAHYASEFPWCSQAADILHTTHPELTVAVLDIRTDPWTVAAGGAHPSSAAADSQ